MASLPLIPPGVRAIFFDAVGTLIVPDPPAPDVYLAVGRRFGSGLGAADIARRFRTAFRRQEALDLAGGLRTDEPREVRRWQAIVAETLDDVRDPEGCFTALFSHFARPDAWRCDPQAGPTLVGLAKAGYRVGIASNFDERLRGIAAALPELRSIQEVAISSAIGWRKPSPQFFEQLCRQTGLPPGQILLVGDDLVNDYEGARAAGLHALLLGAEGGATVPPTARIAQLSDLLSPPA